jgi:hypothetical protein
MDSIHNTVRNNFMTTANPDSIIIPDKDTFYRDINRSKRSATLSILWNQITSCLGRHKHLRCCACRDDECGTRRLCNKNNKHCLKFKISPK